MSAPRPSNQPVVPSPATAAIARTRRPTPPRPVDPAESRELGVRAALALAGSVDPVEVYVDLGTDAVRVALRGNRGFGDSWQVAGPLLRERVLAAVAPLLAAGWRLEGTFLAAARWDVSVASGPDLYQGCWVRMCRVAA
jgi:hypothetical protein